MEVPAVEEIYHLEYRGKSPNEEMAVIAGKERFTVMRTSR